MHLFKKALQTLAALVFSGVFAYSGALAASPYEATVTSQSPYVTLSPGESADLTVTVKNTGTSAWQNYGTNPVNFGLVDPTTRTSLFKGNGWYTANRPAHMTESSVQVGGSTTFTVNVKAPASITPGVYKESFNLVSEGYGFFKSPTIWWNITVPSPYKGQVTSQTPYPTLRPDAYTTLNVSVKNTGSSAWQNYGANPVHLAVANPTSRTSIFRQGWVSDNRPARLTQPSVQPGGTGTFSFIVKAPSNQAPGVYREYFNLVAENYSFFTNDSLMYWDITVPAAYQAEMTAQSPWLTLHRGDTATLTVSYKNKGWSAWSNFGANPVHLALANPTTRTSILVPSAPGSIGWLSANRPANLTQRAVAIDETGSFTFTIKISEDAVRGQTYKEYFNLVAENYTFFTNDSLTMWQITVL